MNKKQWQATASSCCLKHESHSDIACTSETTFETLLGEHVLGFKIHKPQAGRGAAVPWRLVAGLSPRRAGWAVRVVVVGKVAH
jgi:hypothetical protein